MFTNILIACALFLVPLVINVDGIDDRCLGCICQAESHCSPVPCQWDVDSYSCGYYHIKYAYWKDCGSPGLSHRECAADKSCSEQCVSAYMKLYGRQCTGGSTPTCKDYARIHNGGPWGCRASSTLDYWRIRVSPCYSV